MLSHVDQGSLFVHEWAVPSNHGKLELEQHNGGRMSFDLLACASANWSYQHPKHCYFTLHISLFARDMKRLLKKHQSSSPHALKTKVVGLCDKHQDHWITETGYDKNQPNILGTMFSVENWYRQTSCKVEWLFGHYDWMWVEILYSCSFNLIYYSIHNTTIAR